jgi:hypothetical protein
MRQMVLVFLTLKNYDVNVIQTGNIIIKSSLEQHQTPLISNFLCL